MNKSLTTFDRMVHDLQRELSRGLVGFDSIFDGFRSNVGTFDSYPPYNVEKLDEVNYRVSLALAGFSKNDIEVAQEANWLVVTGKAEEKEEGVNKAFLHRGIARRAFTRRIQLADNILVKDAEMQDGLLHINLEKLIPEAEKPRLIEIKSS